MLKDIKNMKRSSKRQNSDGSSTRASIMNVATGEVFPIKDDTECIIGRAITSSILIEEEYISRLHCSIKYQNNRFVISDLNSSSGTFLNCERLPRSMSYLTELQHGDLIGFGEKKNIILSYKFVLHTPPVKRQKLDNEHGVLKVHNLDESFKNTISKLHSEVLNLKADIMVLCNNTKTESAELKNLVSTIEDVTNIQTKQLKATLLEENGRVISNNVNERESLKRQLYTQLENEFQCSICSELVYEAVNANCNHTFCRVCIQKWRIISNNCPVCRASIQTVTNCLSLDNYITKICDFMGGAIQEQRQQQLKERFVPPQTARRGRKRGSFNSRRHPLPMNFAAPTYEDDLNAPPIEVVDLTNNFFF